MVVPRAGDMILIHIFTYMWSIATEYSYGYGGVWVALVGVSNFLLWETCVMWKEHCSN